MATSTRALATVPALLASLLFLAIAAYLSAPAVNVLHLLTFQTPTTICMEQGTPGGFYPPGQTPPSPAGSIVFDPFSIHCSYADWLGEGPVVTVARGWPPLMALMTGACVVAVVCIVWTALRALRNRDARGSGR